ncbi:MAG TPA: methyltransferase domain-containing protein [Dongiaceae bacterium]|nr:methyltransferase domain-containing protein [Dongiaceae bacterium]
MDYEQRVAQHYAKGGLEEKILQALRASGLDIDALKPADLAPVDEFHIGGRQATVNLAAQLDLKPGQHLLDIGSGLGGSSRYFAEAHGARVTGIDLTEDYVRTATALAARVGLAGLVSYRQGSALDLPFVPGSFDGAYLLHVGMNIADKPTLFKGVRRMLKPGGFFAIYDVMREGEGDLRFPLPWASSSEFSFVETAALYRQALEAAGFTIRVTNSLRDFAIEFFRQTRARLAATGTPPALGLHLIMEENAQKLANMSQLLERGTLAPVELIAVAR